MKRILFCVIVIFLFAFLVVSPGDAADRQCIPEIPGNNIDDDCDGTIDESVSDAWTASGADYFLEAESGQLRTWASAADSGASGGNYVALGLSNAYHSGQLRLQHTFTNDTYYLWAKLRNVGNPKACWFDTSLISTTPNNATLATAIPVKNQFEWVAFGTTGSNAELRGTNATGQRTIALNGQQAIFVMCEPGVDLDRFALSPDINADPGTITGGGSEPPASVLLEVLELGANSVTIDGTREAFWGNANTPNFTGQDTTTGNSPAPDCRFAWDDTTTDRLYFHCNVADTDHRAANGADDDASQFNKDSIELRIRKDQTRTKDADTWGLVVDIASTQTWSDFNFPSGVENFTNDFGNVSCAKVVGTLDSTANDTQWSIECGFDLPWAISAGQVGLFNLRVNDKDSGIGLRDLNGTGGGGNLDDVDSWVTFRLSATTIPGVADSTAPTYTTCTTINIGNVSADAQCTVTEAGSSPVSARVKWGTATGVYPNQTAALNCGDGQVCTIALTGLSEGTEIFWKMFGPDGAGNNGESAEISFTTTSASNFFFKVGATGTYAGTSCADTNDTTRCPFGQLTNLQPGDTAIIKNGQHNTQISINGLNGTSSQPITIKAETERQAFIKGDGLADTLRILNSNWLIIQGLRLESTDDLAAADGAGDLVEINNSTNLTFKRNLFRLPNRKSLTTGGVNAGVSGNSSWLLEENESYDFHYHAHVVRGSDHTMRRNYCNSRDRADLAGGVTTANSAHGENCFSLYPASNSIVENNISEGGMGVFELNAAGTAVNNRFFGNISYDSTEGAIPNARGNTLNTMPRDTYMEHMVFANQRKAALYNLLSSSAKNTQCVNCTFLSSSGGGARGMKDASAVGDNSPSIFLTNNAFISVSGSAWHIQNQADYLVDFAGIFSSGSPTPGLADSKVTNEVSFGSNPFGNCKVFVPDGSAAKGAGKAGADIGANVLYAYTGGVLDTSKKLWNSGTREINTSVWGGAIVAGVNDTDALTNVGARLHPSCTTWPSGY